MDGTAGDPGTTALRPAEGGRNIGSVHVPSQEGSIASAIVSNIDHAF